MSQWSEDYLLEKIITHSWHSYILGVEIEQIRTIDKQRLKQYMGMMPNSIMARVDKALAISVSLKGGQNG